MPETAGITVSAPFPREDKYQGAQQAVRDQLAAGRLSDTNRGPATARLEQTFADLAGTRFALSFNSGTAALHSALHATGTHPEAGVAVSPMTWISALTASLHAGSFPVFCDVEPGSLNLDAKALAAAASACSATVVTHAWGVPARMDAINAATPLAVVEDCSHAHGALYLGRPVGGWGSAGCFSLQESKSVSAGEGGALTTSDRTLYERALLLGHHPHRLSAEITQPDLLPFVETGAAHKFRMPVLAALIAQEQLRTLADRSHNAEVNLAALTRALDGDAAPAVLPPLAEGSRRGWYGAPLTITEPVSDPTGLMQKAVACGIPVRPLYEDWVRAPLFQQPHLLQRMWPHVRLTPYTPPDPDSLPNYYLARRQTLVIKVPTVPAADYMHDVARVLSSLLTRHLNV